LPLLPHGNWQELKHTCSQEVPTVNGSMRVSLPSMQSRFVSAR
jgi:hypothetical protein